MRIKDHLAPRSRHARSRNAPTPPAPPRIEETVRAVIEDVIRELEWDSMERWEPVIGRLRSVL